MLPEKYKRNSGEGKERKRRKGKWKGGMGVDERRGELKGGEDRQGTERWRIREGPRTRSTILELYL